MIQRPEDEPLKSVFVTSDPAIKSLTGRKGKDASFGSRTSARGHLMPRKRAVASPSTVMALNQAGAGRAEMPQTVPLCG